MFSITGLGVIAVANILLMLVQECRSTGGDTRLNRLFLEHGCQSCDPDGPHTRYPSGGSCSQDYSSCGDVGWSHPSWIREKCPDETLYDAKRQECVAWCSASTTDFLAKKLVIFTYYKCQTRPLFLENAFLPPQDRGHMTTGGPYTGLGNAVTVQPTDDDDDDNPTSPGKEVSRGAGTISTDGSVLAGQTTKVEAEAGGIGLNEKLIISLIAAVVVAVLLGAVVIHNLGDEKKKVLHSYFGPCCSSGRPRLGSSSLADSNPSYEEMDNRSSNCSSVSNPEYADPEEGLNLPPFSGQSMVGTMKGRKLPEIPAVGDKREPHIYNGEYDEIPPYCEYKDEQSSSKRRVDNIYHYAETAEKEVLKDKSQSQADGKSSHQKEDEIKLSDCRTLGLLGLKQKPPSPNGNATALHLQNSDNDNLGDSNKRPILGSQNEKSSRTITDVGTDTELSLCGVVAKSRQNVDAGRDTPSYSLNELYLGGVVARKKQDFEGKLENSDNDSTPSIKSENSSSRLVNSGSSYAVLDSDEVERTMRDFGESIDDSDTDSTFHSHSRKASSTIVDTGTENVIDLSGAVARARQGLETAFEGTELNSDDSMA